MFIILMKNVSPVQKKYQIRIYDIKGSEFNRSTLEERDIHDSSLSKYTLKDIDFKNLEGRVTITTK